MLSMLHFQLFLGVFILKWSGLFQSVNAIKMSWFIMWLCLVWFQKDMFSEHCSRWICLEWRCSSEVRCFSRWKYRSQQLAHFTSVELLLSMFVIKVFFIFISQAGFVRFVTQTSSLYCVNNNAFQRNIIRKTLIILWHSLVFGIGVPMPKIKVYAPRGKAQCKSISRAHA